MIDSTFKLSMIIGATQSDTFGNTVRGTHRQLNNLGSELKKLGNRQNAIRDFEINEASVNKARIQYRDAAREVSRLKKEIAASEQPTRRQQQALARATQQAQRFSKQVEKKRENLRRARQQLDRFGLSTHSLVADNTRLGQSIDKLSRKYQRLGATIKAQERNRSRRSQLRGDLFDTVAIGAAVATPVSIAIDFEESIARLGAISQTEGDALAGLSNEAKRLGRETFFSASQSSEAMQFLAMAGFETGEIMKATSGVLDLAQASGADLGRTADISSNILSGFSLSADQMNRVGDVMVGTFTKSNTTMESLGETMKFVAPVASSVGASIEEVAAMSGLLGDVGIQGSLAGTALRSAFLRLSAPPKMAADALEELGIQTKDTEGNLRSLPVLFKEISDAAGDFGSGDRAEVVSRIFGKEASAAMTELLKQVNTFDKGNDEGLNNLEQRIKNLNLQTVKAREVAEKMGETTAGSLKRMGSAFEAAAISLGSVLLPTIASGADALAGIASWVALTAEKFPVLTKVVVGVTTGLIALRIVTLASMFTYSVLTGAVLSLKTAFITMGVSTLFAKLGLTKLNILAGITAVRTGIMTAAQWAWNAALTANPIGLVIAGVGALIAAGALLVTHWEKVTAFFSRAWKFITDVKNSVFGGEEEVRLNVRKDVPEFNASLTTQNPQRIGQSFTTQPLNEAVSAPITNNPSFFTQQGNRNESAPVFIGESVGATQGLPSAIAPTPLVNTVQPASVNNSQSVTIQAPITIHPSQGMDEHAIGREVQRALGEREARVNAQQRAQLFDRDNL